MSANKAIQLIHNFTSTKDYTYPNDLVLLKKLTASVLDRLDGKADKQFSQVFSYDVIFG